MSPKTLRNLLTALLILVGGVVITGALIRGNKKPEQKTPPPSTPLVTVFAVSAERSPVSIQSFGTVKAKRSITVVPQVSGEVLEKADAFEPGGFVAKGELLLKIDDTDYVLAYENARSNVAQAEYNLALAEEEAMVARQEWERMSRSNLSGSDAEPTPLVLRKPQLKLAAANLEAARAALKQSQVNLGRCTLTAPFDGRVLSADVDAGQYLRAGSPVGGIYAIDVAEVTVSVPDEDTAWIAVGEASEPVAVAARFAGQVHRWSGRAVRMGGAVDERSRLVPIVVEIEAPYEADGDRPALVEGMFVEITFSTVPPTGSVVVPRSALRPGDVVWIVDGEGRLTIRPVTVARKGVEQAVLSAGLRPGDLVCDSNLQYVTEGMKVRIEGESE